MENEFSLERIREFWTDQANTHGQSASASWSDHPVIELEIQELLKHLNSGDRVLDIGCANGYSTVRLASQRDINIRGVDYIPEMVEQAISSLATTDDELKARISFGVGDITSLEETDDSFDRVVVTRVVINLREWEIQAKALQECIRVIKPGGMLLLSEATLQGWKKLNAFREEWGLSEIPIPPFNEYLDVDQVVAELAPQMKLVNVFDFASTYFVATRVFKPLLARLSDTDVDIATPDMEFNRFSAMLPAIGDYGTQKLMVFQKQ